MNDRERLDTARTLLSVVSSREAFIGTTRWRAKEWSRLVFTFYIRVYKDDPIAASLLLANYYKRKQLSNRQMQWLKDYDQWSIQWLSEQPKGSVSTILVT